ncbi:MAG: hypothetical protein LBO63_00505 [Oscillospiraceae bacterium]|jgi:hypothetical protein|nr:hypothetical protein [Oscillospiraceae bacterium]
MKNKITRLFCAAVCLTLALSLAACRRTDKPEEPSDTPPTTSAVDPTVPEGEFVFMFDGTPVSLIEPLTAIQAIIGAPSSEEQKPDSTSRTMYYDGFYITTFQSGTITYVRALIITENTVSTAEGITLGSTADDIKAAYGDTPEFSSMSDVYKYTRGGVNLMFVTGEEERVMAISYLNLNWSR